MERSVIRSYKSIESDPNGTYLIVSMVALGCGLGIVPKAVLDNSTAAKRVSAIKISNIEPYHLGLSCLKSRVNEPLIAAFIAQGA